MVRRRWASWRRGRASCGEEFRERVRRWVAFWRVERERGRERSEVDEGEVQRGQAHEKW